MTDFGALPPEVNSARMYSGPGPDSLALAAGAWDRLAIELRSAADSHASVISSVTMQWSGPSSVAMAAAATPYSVWLGDTAAQAELTAAQARDAVTAYETARASTVAPLQISANRAQLAMLLATNVIGQNAAPIAAAEAEYGEMWAQDAAAMYAYAAQSAAATVGTPFAPPPQGADPAGATAQAASVAQATGTSTQSGLAQVSSAVHSALQSLAVPAAASPTATTGVTSIFEAGGPLSSLLEAYEFAGPALLPVRNTLIASTAYMALTSRGLQAGSVPVAAAATPPLAAGLASAPTVASAAPSSAVASLGRGGSVGGLSVPPSWTTATPTIRLAAAALQTPVASGATVLTQAGSGTVFGQMALGSFLGGAMGAAIPRSADPNSDPTPAVESADGSTTSKGGKTEEKLKRVLADLSEKPESVQHWHTDKAQLESLLEQLSKKPGVHAVHVSSRDKPNRNRPRWG